MRTVILVSASAKPGGAEHGFRLLVEHLPLHGWRPVPVLLEDGPLRKWLEPNVVVLEAGRTRQLRRTISTIQRLSVLARDNQASVLVSNLSKTHVYGGAAGALAHIPTVWWQQDTPRGSRIEQVAARVPAATVVCVSEASAEAQRLLTPRRDVQIVYLGSGVPSALAGAGAEIRQRLGWENADVFGIIGRLQEWKGQELFLEAAARVARSNPNTRFLVVGGAILGWEGDYPRRLEARASQLGLGDRVHFTGHQDDVAPWYDAIDVVVHASTAEPFGLVLVEAMGLGKAVITASEGGAREIVEDEISGLIVRSREPDALAATMSRVLVEPGLASRLGAGGRDRAQLFTPERSVSGFAAVLDRVASRTLSARAS